MPTIEDYRLTIGFEFEFLTNSRNANSVNNSTPKGWNMSGDGSLSGFKEYYYDKEAQSKPFDLDDSNSGIPDTYRSYLAKLETLARTNYTCGIHCHIIANSGLTFSAEVLEALAKKFNPFPNKWRESNYTHKGVGGYAVRNSKYYVINNITPNHIEIRAFNGSLRWATFLRYFIQIRKALVSALGEVKLEKSPAMVNEWD